MTSHSVAQRSTNRANPSTVDEKLYNLGRGKVGERRQKRVPLQPRALCGRDQFLTRIALYGADYLQRKTSVFQVRRDKSTCENTKEQNSKLTAHEPECKTHANSSFIASLIRGKRTLH